MINIIHAPILFIGILSLFFSFVSILFKKRVYNKFKEAKKERYDYKPTVSVLLPVKDVDKNLGATLKSLLNQDYPKTKYDITIIVEKNDKETRNLIESTTGKNKTIRVAYVKPLDSCSHKNSALLSGLKMSKNEVIVFVDSDAVPNKKWIKNLVGPLQDKDIGATTGYRFYKPSKSFVSYVLCAWNNIGLSQMLGKHVFAWGGSCAIRKNLLYKLKIPSMWKKSISDDAIITEALRKTELKIKFVPMCIARSEMSQFSKLFEFTTRQMMVVRLYFKKTWKMASFFYIGNLVVIILGIAASYYFLTTGSMILLVESAMFISSILIGFIRAYLDCKNLRNLENLEIKSAPSYIIADFCANILLAYNILRSRTRKTLEWRGIKYRINSPYDIEVVKR